LFIHALLPYVTTLSTASSEPFTDSLKHDFNIFVTFVTNHITKQNVKLPRSPIWTFPWQSSKSYKFGRRVLGIWQLQTYGRNM